MFILRIFFSGLIAFVPSEDGKELTVLLLNAPHAHHSTMHPGIPEHKPVLLARAADCAPECPRTEASVAAFLYPDITSRDASSRALADAVHKGVVWPLSGSKLSLGIPNDGVKLVRSASPSKSVPDNHAERADFGWVANLRDIHPSIGDLDPAVFSDNPPKELIVARLTLKSGKVSTRSVIQVNGKVVPIDFRPPSGKGKPYARAVASWVQAEIQVPGDSLEVVEERFSDGRKRTISLKPLDGVIDMAILNISRPVRPAGTRQPQRGMHFTRFWDLAARPPAANDRPIPQAPAAGGQARNFAALHADGDRRKSDLLKAIFVDERGPYDQLLCPMSQYPRP